MATNKKTLGHRKAVGAGFSHGPGRTSMAGSRSMSKGPGKTSMRGPNPGTGKSLSMKATSGKTGRAPSSSLQGILRNNRDR